MDAIRVLKFGSSVLGSRRDVSLALHEIYRALREGSRVVAVVSALGRTTDRLVADARRMGARSEESAFAHLLATGEARAVALLALALDRAGIPAAVLDPAQLGLRTRGPLLDAQPVDLDAAVLHEALLAGNVAVVPGFVGRDEHGRTSLLGRGGSDLTALFLAQRLGASCRLVKDVPGVFDRDPAVHPGSARRFAMLAWDDTFAVGGRIVQEKALRFAREHRFPFEVGALGSSGATLVGAGPTRLDPVRREPAALRVALLGLGTVGLGVYRELARFPERFSVEAVLVRRKGLGRPAGIPGAIVTTEPERILRGACDVVVEVLGGAEPAGALIEASLRRGAHVVTANKGLIVARGAEFHALAACSGARFSCSASVCGALPVLEVVRRCARERPIAAIEGVLNSTTNVVLELLAQGRSMGEALASARRRGFCEHDPREDLDGTDAAHKLTLVAREAFGPEVAFHWLERTGITALDPEAVREAALSGRSARLVASCRRTENGVELRVAPRNLDQGHLLAQVRGEGNAVVIHASDGARIVLRGKGAGRWPTAQSVVGDLLELSRLQQDEARNVTSAEPAAAS